MGYIVKGLYLLRSFFARGFLGAFLRGVFSLSCFFKSFERRDLRRAALFLWMTFFFTAVSREEYTFLSEGREGDFLKAFREVLKFDLLFLLTAFLFSACFNAFFAD